MYLFIYHFIPNNHVTHVITTFPLHSPICLANYNIHLWRARQVKNLLSEHRKSTDYR